MSEQSPVPEGYPMMQAWGRYEASPEYANSFRWAAQEQHRAGSMWAAFVAGWQATDLRDAEIERLRAALLGYVRNENGCIFTGPYHESRCTGWDAEKCGCAVEARAAITTQPSKTETRDDE